MESTPELMSPDSAAASETDAQEDSGYDMSRANSDDDSDVFLVADQEPLSPLGLKRRRGTSNAAETRLPVPKRSRIYDFGPLIAHIRRSFERSGSTPLLADLEEELGDAQGLELCRLFGFDGVVEYVTAAVERGAIFPVDASGALVLTEASYLEDPSWNRYVWWVKRPQGTNVELPDD